MKILTIALLICAMLIGLCPVFAVDIEPNAAADVLFDLGLFQGTGTDSAGKPIYALDAEPTRGQALVMLIRLIGSETEAQGGNWSHPFNDVDTWLSPYVGYAFEKGITAGMSADTFGSNETALPIMYVTFVLRALGYSDSGNNPNFSYYDSVTFANSIGLTNEDFAGGFLRGDVAVISHTALGLKMNNSNKTLIQTLVDSGAVNAQKAINAGFSVDTPSGGNTDPFDRDTYHIIYYNHLISIVATQCFEALTAVGEVWNFTVEYQTANGDGDYYIDNLETILLTKPDGLVVDVASEYAVRVSEICRQHDIPVIAIYYKPTDPNGVSVIPSVIPDQFLNGRTQLQFLIDNYKNYWGDIDTSKIAFLNIDWSQNPDLTNRGIGGKQLWDEVFPGQLFIQGDTGYDNISPDTGFTVATNILTENPEVEYWFITVNLEYNALGVARAVEALGIEEKCLIASSGAAVLPEEWDAGYNGSWIANFSIPPFFYVGTATMGLLEIIEGRATMNTLWPEHLQQGDKCATYIAFSVMMTRENYKELIILTAAKFGVDLS